MSTALIIRPQSKASLTRKLQPSDPLHLLIAELSARSGTGQKLEDELFALRGMANRLTECLSRQPSIADLSDETHGVFTSWLETNATSRRMANLSRLAFERLHSYCYRLGLCLKPRSSIQQENVRRSRCYNSSLDALVDNYFLTHELKPATQEYYRRTVHLFSKWFFGCCARTCELDDFTVDAANRFLVSKQRDGASPFYRHALRNGLTAILRFAGQEGTIRTVKTGRLNVEAWSPEEVEKLVDAVPRVIGQRGTFDVCSGKIWFWKSIILAAWYTGLSHVDLSRIERSHVQPGGIVVIDRSKTGKRAVVWLPPDLVREIHRRYPGPIWALKTSREFFRREFRRIVAEAGLTGSFKKLRKSSGTAIEISHPGRGHEHLANSRAIFEKHYLSVAAMPLDPLKPPTIGRKAKGGGA